MKNLFVVVAVALCALACSDRAGIGAYASAGAILEAQEQGDAKRAHRSAAEFLGNVLSVEEPGLGTFAAIGAAQTALEASE
jgi:hypothetical protein